MKFLAKIPARTNKVLSFFFIFLLFAAGLFAYVLPATKELKEGEVLVWYPLGSKDILCLNRNCYQNNYFNEIRKEKFSSYKSAGYKIDAVSAEPISINFLRFPVKIATLLWDKSSTPSALSSFLVKDGQYYFISKSNSEKTDRLYVFNSKTRNLSSFYLERGWGTINSVNSSNTLILISRGDTWTDPDNSIEARSLPYMHKVIDVRDGRTKDIGFYDEFFWHENDTYSIKINREKILPGNPELFCMTFEGKLHGVCDIDNLLSIASYQLVQIPDRWTFEKALSRDNGTYVGELFYLTKVHSENSYFYIVNRNINFMPGEAELSSYDKVEDFLMLRSYYTKPQISAKLYYNNYHSDPIMMDDTPVALAIFDRDGLTYNLTLQYSGREIIKKAAWDQAFKDFKYLLNNISLERSYL